MEEGLVLEGEAMKWLIPDGDEIQRDGGLVIVTDTTGMEWQLTLEEAKFMPFADSYVKCELRNGQ